MLRRYTSRENKVQCLDIENSLKSITPHTPLTQGGLKKA